MAKPKVYNSHLSPFGRKVYIVLHLKGVAYEDEQIMLFRGPPANWSEISPLRKVPVYEEDGVRIPDSTVICEYLEERFPQPALLPADPLERARCRWFEEYADTEIAGKLVRAIFFERVVRGLLMKQEVDETMVQKALQEDLPPIMDYLEKELAGGKRLAGDALSMADIAVASQLVNLHHAGWTLDGNRWPGVAALYQHIISLPEVASILEIEHKILRKISS